MIQTHASRPYIGKRGICQNQQSRIRAHWRENEFFIRKIARTKPEQILLSGYVLSGGLFCVVEFLNCSSF